MLPRRNKWSTTVIRPTFNNTSHIQAIRKDLHTLPHLKGALHMDTQVLMHHRLNTVARTRYNLSDLHKVAHPDSLQSLARIQSFKCLQLELPRIQN
jgi:hypothetical protein